MRTLMITTMLAALLATTGCGNDTTREQGARTQEQLMQRATHRVPTPTVTHFLTRRSVAQWMQRMDRPNKIFYVYVMADTGQPIGYYTAQNRPISTCTRLTPPDRITDKVGTPNNLVTEAPALDGVYYGASRCQGVFFFDAATDAYIEISGFHYVVTDQPLKIEAQPIQVAGIDRAPSTTHGTPVRGVPSR